MTQTPFNAALALALSLFLALVVPQAALALPLNACGDLFATSHEADGAWPPSDWNEFFGSVNLKGGSRAVVSTRLIQPKVVELTPMEKWELDNKPNPTALRNVNDLNDSGAWGFLQQAQVLDWILEKFRNAPQGKAHVDITPVEQLGTNLFRFTVVTRIEDESSITEYHETAVLPGDRTYLHAAIIGVDKAQQQHRFAQRMGPPVRYEVPGIDYHYVNLGQGHPMPPDLNERLASGKAQQISHLRRFLSVVYPDYVKRRKWTKDLVSDLYRHSVATLNNTPFVLVMEKAADRQAPVVGAFGVNRVSYGKVRFFNAVTQQWTEVTGATDGGLAIDFPEIYHDAESPRRPENWWTPVPILGMEEIDGHPLTLDRPVDETDFIPPQPHLSPVQIAPDLIADLSKGVFFYGGQIGEPTKLWMAKQSPIRAQTERKLWGLIADTSFPNWRSQTFNFLGTALYTYNPAREWPLLYGPKEFIKAANQPQLMLDGKPWDVLLISHWRASAGTGNKGAREKFLEGLLRH